MAQISPNFLSQTGFRLEIDRLPNVTFFAQNCVLPQISMYDVTINTPMLDYPLPGNKLIFNEFNLQFIIDENMENYGELTKWIYGINNPESLDLNREYSIAEHYRLARTGQTLYKSLFSDATLHILNNNNNENIMFQFLDMFPVSVSGFTFGSTVDDIHYITCNAKFSYSLFKEI